MKTNNLEEEINYRLNELYGLKDKLVKEALQRYNDETLKYDELNCNRPFEERFVLNDWKYKSEVWKAATCSVFIDLKPN